MKKLLIAIAASSLLSGCCVFGAYTLDKEGNEWIPIQPPDAKPLEEKNTKVMKAIQICRKQSVNQCREAYTSKSNQCCTSNITERDINNFCGIQYEGFFEKYESTYDTMYRNSWRSKYFDNCMKENGYIKHTTVIGTRRECKPFITRF